MAETVSGVNPNILVWARRQAGLSVDEVARRMKKSPAVIESWETGDDAPTYSQLEILAYSVFRRPLALFFFPEPPDEPSIERSFRTLPETEADDLAPDTRYKIRQARALQLSLKELNGDTNPAERRIFDDIVVNSRDSASEVAIEVRAYLGVEVESRGAWHSASDWLKECRRSLGDVGVYVFKDSFKQKDVSGFCLYDSEFPIIYLNNSTAATRQVFTLFHELAHVLLHTNGITKLDDDYVGSLSKSERRIEVFCNRFAAEVLVPEKDFHLRVGELRPDEDLVNDLAREFRVSREAILRRFLDLERVSQADYDAMVESWNAGYEARSGRSGGDYYATRASYLGEKYLGLVFGRYYQGSISEQRLADLLGVKTRSIPGLEEQYLRSASG